MIVFIWFHFLHGSVPSPFPQNSCMIYIHLNMYFTASKQELQVIWNFLCPMISCTNCYFLLWHPDGFVLSVLYEHLCCLLTSNHFIYFIKSVCLVLKIPLLPRFSYNLPFNKSLAETSPQKKSIILQPWGNSCENLQHYKPTEAKNKTGNFCTKLNFSSSPTSHRRARETQQQIQNLWVLFKNLGVKFLSSEQTECAASPASGLTENMDF